MSRRLVFWLLIAWPLPALAAGVLGWKGIWGSGSAVLDYLIPIPVAGGALHVPSFVMAALAVHLLPDLGPLGASRVRALLLGTAAAGVLWLLKLDAMLLALQTGSTTSGSLWQENALGLFLASDALLALAFTAGAPQRPMLRLEALTAVLVLLPAALPVAMAWPRSADEEPFRTGQRRYGDERGDETIMVFTRLPVDGPDFRARAEAWVTGQHSTVNPRHHVDIEDAAILFTRSLDAARGFDLSQAAITLCLYEDGTPQQWLPGAGDCFSGHLNFSERLRRSTDERPRDEHPDLRLYFGARKVCEGLEAPPVPPDPLTALSSTRICSSLERMRDELRRKFPNELESPGGIR